VRRIVVDKKNILNTYTRARARVYAHAHTRMRRNYGELHEIRTTEIAKGAPRIIAQSVIALFTYFLPPLSLSLPFFFGIMNFAD